MPSRPLPQVPTTLLLLLAIAGEVAGTASLRLSEGLERPWFVAGVMLCYGTSIMILGRVLIRGIPLGVAYGLLTAAGLVAATVLSAGVFGDRLGPTQIGGIVVLGVGAWLLQIERA